MIYFIILLLYINILFILHHILIYYFIFYCLTVISMFVFHNMCIIKIKGISHLYQTPCSLWQRVYVLFVIGSVLACLDGPVVVSALVAHC